MTYACVIYGTTTLHLDHAKYDITSTTPSWMQSFCSHLVHNTISSSSIPCDIFSFVLSRHSSWSELNTSPLAVCGHIAFKLRE